MNKNRQKVIEYLTQDAGLFDMCREAVRNTKNKDEATRELMRRLPKKTPEGVRVTHNNVRLALIGI